jgi:predicted RNase H-like HicB family nuclease
MMNEIIFMIEDDPDGGYNAQALGYSIFTQGETVEELKENIMDALRCHFDEIKNMNIPSRFPKLHSCARIRERS